MRCAMQFQTSSVSHGTSGGRGRAESARFVNLYVQAARVGVLGSTTSYKNETNATFIKLLAEWTCPEQFLQQ